MISRIRFSVYGDTLPFTWLITFDTVIRLTPASAAISLIVANTLYLVS